MAIPARILVAALACVAACIAQPAFEAASVKVYDPASAARFSMSGGPGTSDPARFFCRNCSLRSLIVAAYDIREFQLSSPSWPDRYDVEANVPAGATKDEFRLMLQNLLAERFRLQVHHQSQEMTGYTLVVARSGSRLTRSQAPPPADPSLPNITTSVPGNGTYRMKATNAPMTKVVSMLSTLLAKPVYDMTGIESRNDFELSWYGNPTGIDIGPRRAQDGSVLPADPDAESGPTIFAALQQQLGLKLEAAKEHVDVIVVDHADKMPTVN